MFFKLQNFKSTRVICTPWTRLIDRMNMLPSLLLCLFVRFASLCKTENHAAEKYGNVLLYTQSGQFGPVNQKYMLPTFSVQVQLSVPIYIYCVLVKIAPIQLYLYLFPSDRLAVIFSQPLHPLVTHDNFLSVKLLKKKKTTTKKNN